MNVNMETLMSLLGDNKETIIQSLNTLAENGNKNKLLKEEITDLNEQIKNLKEQNQQKAKDIERLKDDLDYERDTNEEMENEIISKEEELHNVQKYVKNRDDTINKLDEIIAGRIEEINYLRENCADLAKQLPEAIILEETVKAQTNVIKELKDEQTQNKKNEHVLKEETEKLKEDIKILEKENKVKEELLENIKDENKEVQVKLKLMEENTRRQELFKCKTCNDEFHTLVDLSSHMTSMHGVVAEKEILKAQLTKIEIANADEKLKLTSTLIELKEKETKERNICRCKGFCHINHNRHNWQKSKSARLFSVFLNLKTELTGTLKKNYPCDDCKETFVIEEALKLHVRTCHKTSSVITA